MPSTIFRVIIIYFIVFICLRFMGKKQMGQMQPFEIVIMLIIADLATIPMAQQNVPLLKGIIPVLALTIIQLVMSFLSQKSIFMRKAITGKSVIVINPNGINFKALKKLGMNFNDLVEAVRNNNCNSLEEVLYFIVETNGKITVIKKGQFTPPTAIDLKVAKDEGSLPVTIIADGKILKTNCSVLELSKDRVECFVHKVYGTATKIKDICIFTIDQNGKIYIQRFGDNAISTTVNFSGGVIESDV